MAVETPVLERVTTEKHVKECAVPSRMEFLEEEEHNARIRDTYARLINPDSKIEDVFSRTLKEQYASKAAEEVKPGQKAEPQAQYRVENARANSALFRADSAINAKKEEVVEVPAKPIAVAKAATVEEDDEDLRPTPTTIQYQTVGKQGVQQRVSSTSESKKHMLCKREKIIIAVFVAVVVALLVLVVVNSAIISNLNSDIATVQNGITTVRGALAGVNGEIEEIINNYLMP